MEYSLKIVVGIDASAADLPSGQHIITLLKTKNSRDVYSGKAFMNRSPGKPPLSASIILYFTLLG